MSAPAVEVTRPQRWDQPFGERPLSDAEVARVLSRLPFARIDESSFSPALPLREILRNDCRLVRYVAGDVVFREGDYGTSAFFVLAGRVRILVERAELEIEGGERHERRGVLQALAQLWQNSPIPEARDYEADFVDPRICQEGPYIRDTAGTLDRHRTLLMEAGAFFGEVAALGRTPRSAHAFAETAAEILEIRWQGLRDIARRTPEIRQHIDDLYRQNALENELHLNPVFRHLTDEARLAVGAEVAFESYGDRSWSATYRRSAERGAESLLASEPLIAEEGSYPNGLLLIRNGFARVSRRHGSGERSISYLGRGQVFGLEEIVENWQTGHSHPYRHSLRAIGYVDVLQVPTRTMEQIVLPAMPGLSPSVSGGLAGVPRDVLEKVVDGRYMNGSAAMLIDLERCTRCDDCVRACAAAHDGNPRFVRHGESIGRFMIANACMHCVDPVCMIGCPTGAIHRLSPGGQVAIHDRTCIGCGTCAGNCPYDNIRMVEVRDAAGAPMLERESRAPILKATKCDLCVDQAVHPACQNACPHDALKRVDLRDASLLLELGRG